MAVSPCPDSCPIARRFAKPRPPTTAEDNRQSFAPSVTAAALLNRNTGGKPTHTPQLKGVEELDNPSLQKGERHE
jgi:hypothetical protein